MPRPLILLSIWSAALTGAATAATDQPNIVWLTVEDISAQLGCYEDPHAVTPHLDQLANEGTVYWRAFTTAGVCAPSRSAIITGMHQSSLGSQHMRNRIRLPEHIELFPAYLCEAGYYTTNNAKTDYQIPKDDPAVARAWDEVSGKAHWRNRPDPNQPFFAVFCYRGTHESRIRDPHGEGIDLDDLPTEYRQEPAALTTLPPYYPDTLTNRRNWATYYELITVMDAWVGDMIQQLKEDGLYDNTIIFFWSDHGVGLPRAKRWLHDSGTRVPLIVRAPAHLHPAGLLPPGSVDRQLVSGIDYAPTVLNLAGISLPEHLQGRAFLGRNLSPEREYIFSARDRVDERYDIVRAVRDERFRYVRNYEPFKPYYPYMNSSESSDSMAELRTRYEAGTLEAPATKYFGTKPNEELYDLSTDPHEVTNIAGDPAYASVLQRMRQAHLRWAARIRDTGLIPEPLLVRGEDKLGSRHAILDGPDGEALLHRLEAAADLANAGPQSLGALAEALHDPEPAIRYWAAIGLGNQTGPSATFMCDDLRAALDDEEPVVRVAAARALCAWGEPAPALPVLVDVLETGRQWERLYAANVLDEIDDQARPVNAALHDALAYREDFLAKGKYVVRVVNRALNELEGTDRKVR